MDTFINSVVIGVGASSQKEGCAAVGNGAVTNAKNSVALGLGSESSKENEVSIGNENLKRRLANLADGTESSDGVNLAQLNSVKDELSSLSLNLDEKINKKINTKEFNEALELKADKSELEEIKSSIGSVYKVKGNLPDIEALNALTKKEVGDVYNLLSTGGNYVFDGSSWDKLGGSFDTSGLASDILGTLNGFELSDDGKSLEAAVPTIVIPQGVEVIKAKAFLGDGYHKKILFPDSLKVIQKEAFAGFSSYPLFKLPSGVTRIEDWAFGSLTDKDISQVAQTLPDSIEYLGQGALAARFDQSEVTFPPNLRFLDINYFYWPKQDEHITKITLPPHMKVFGLPVVTGGSGLSLCTQLVLNDELESIISYIGNKRGLNAVTHLEIPPLLESDKYSGIWTEYGYLHGFAFSNFDSLQTVVYKSGRKSIKSNLFSHARTKVTQAWGNRITSVTFNDDLERIEDNAMLALGLITSLEFPTTMRYIGHDAIRVGFDEDNITPTLKSVNLPAGCEYHADSFPPLVAVNGGIKIQA